MQNICAMRAVLAVLLTAVMILCPIPATALLFGNGAVATTALIADIDDGTDPSGRSLRGPIGNSDIVDATGFNNQRKLLRDPTGKLHAVFSKTGQIHYTNSSDQGISWISTIVISGPSALAKHPSIAIAGTHFYFVWEDGGNISFRRTPDMGKTWVPPLANPPVVLEANYTTWPRLPVVAASNLDVMVVWSGFDDGTTSYEIQSVRSTNNGSVFAPMVTLTNSGQEANNPSISANGTGFYLVYHMGSPPTRKVWSLSSTTSGASWDPAVEVSGSLGDSGWPNIVSIGNKLYVTWVSITANNPEIVFKKSIDGGVTWDLSAQLISENPSNSKGPMVAALPNGDLYIVWFDTARNLHNDTFMRKYNASSATWEPKFQASDLDEGYSYPSTNPYPPSERVEYLFTHARQPTYSVIYSFQLTLNNSHPTLEWTGETNYESTGLFPEAGHTTANVYSFRIKYTDADNNEPLSAVRVLVDYNQDGRMNWYDDKENYPMLETEPWDTDYRDGKVYAWSMKYPGVGTNYKYRFYAVDAAYKIAKGVGMDTRDYPDINIIDHEPRLFWTNEKGYSSDGVEPATGTSSTNFTWHVSYFHQDNNPPALGYPKLTVDINNDSLFTVDEYFNMTELDPDDKAYDDGKFYSYSRTLPNVDKYTYRIFTQDNWGIPNLPTDKPSLVNQGPQVTVINTAPTVTYPPVPGLSDNGLDPNSGSTSRVFEFKIIYTDAENNAPAKGYPKVWIDRDLDNVFSDTEKFAMTAENTSDTVYSDGKVYKYTTQYPTVGTYTYRFEARDSWDQQASGSTVGLQTGPDITKSNDAPTLSWPVTEGYITDGVNPDKGRETTRFTFSVIYSDKNNDPPLAGYPTVWLDKDLDHIKDTGETVTMTEVDPADVSYDSGKLYSYSLIIGKNGRYSYSFDAWDGFDGQATGAPTIAVGGPDVASNWNNPPRLEWAGGLGFESDGVDPDSGANTQIFTYKVKYIDYDNDTPITNYPKLYLDLTGNGDYNETNERQVMWEDDQNFTDNTVGKVYVYTTDLTTSFTITGTSYSYMFLAQDVKGSDAVGRPLSKTFGPNITSGNAKPDLVWAGTINYESDGLHPENGNTTQEFVYKVKYIDPDNDQPLPGYPKVFVDNDIIGRTMSKENAADESYSTGVIYIYKTTLNLGNNHKYRFLAFDQYNTKASASDAPMMSTDGPLVENNNPPVLTWTLDGLFKNGVDKAKPTAGTKVTFKVVYSDIEGDSPAPGFPRLYIDRNGDGDFTDALESVEMVQETSDYRNGATYTMDMVLEKGKHSYRFEAWDVRGNAATGDPVKLQDQGLNVKAQSVSSGPDMLIYIVFIVLIVVIAVVAFMVGKKMGGKGTKPAKVGEQAQPPAQPQAQTPEQYYQQQGYAYDPNYAAHQYQQPVDQARPPQVQAPAQQQPVPVPAQPPNAPVQPPAKPASTAHAPQHQPAPAAPAKPSKPPEHPPKA